MDHEFQKSILVNSVTEVTLGCSSSPAPSQLQLLK